METHEPRIPQNWPVGHVFVQDATLTRHDECILVTIHGVQHYLHANTARQLSNMLIEALDYWNATWAEPHGIPVV